MARKEALAGIPPPMEPPHNHNFRCVQASARRRIPRATSISHRGRTYRRHPPFIYQPQAGGSGVGALIAMAVIAALEKAAPNYMPLARQANSSAINTPHQGLPAGPHIALYRTDTKDF